MSQYFPSVHSVHPSQMPMHGPNMMAYGPQPMAQVPMPLYGNMMQQPMVPQVPVAYPGYYNYNPYSIGARLRHLFGFAPKHIRYKSSRGTWGFMGYSRRQRYIDPRTGMEVDRQGRLIYRV